MLILDQKERCGNWARCRAPHVASWGDWYQAIGWERRGALIAVVIFNSYSGVDISMHVRAIPGKRWLTREALRAAFRYPFIQLGCRRVTAEVPSRNTAALSFDKALGFQYEGTKRDGTVDDDIVILGMRRSECRWL